MSEEIELCTDRLILRQWKESDFLPFSKINADPIVMTYYPSTLSTQESNAMANKLMELIAERSWGFWAVETKKENNFIGFVGLHIPGFDLPVSPCVEIGWRLGKAFWGKGYATEAARESLRFAFEELSLNQIYSFASVANKRSRSVMVRLNMVNTGNNFEHPMIPEGNPHREHVLYKITKEQWRNNAG